VTVRKAAGDVYAATIDDKIAMKIGPGDWWVVIEKGGWLPTPVPGLPVSLIHTGSTCLHRSPNQTGIKFNGKELKLATAGTQFAVWEAQP
jgi:alpha-amylase